MNTYEYYHSLYQDSPDLVLSLDLEGNILEVNKRVETYGFTKGILLNQSFFKFVSQNQIEVTRNHFNLAKEGEATVYDSLILNGAYESIEVSIKTIPIVLKNQIVGVHMVIRDNSEFKKTERALLERDSVYKDLAEDSLIGFYIIQKDRFMYVNPQTTQMLGYSRKDLIGKSVKQIIHPDDWPTVNHNIHLIIQGVNPSIHSQFRVIRNDGEIIYLEVHGSRTFYKEECAVFGTLVDITAKKKAEEMIEYLAYHDSLTGLSNRHHFYKRINTAIQQSDIHNLAVLFIDLDRFKIINDSMGHGIGDKLLQEVSKRLKDSAAINEENLARNGGDEFLISMANRNQQEISHLTKRIIDCFAEPFHIDQYEIYTTPSIGISCYPHDGEDVETLIKKADIAMYQAKRKGKNNFHFYSSNEIDSSQEELEEDRNLRRALEQEEFLLHYQPKLNLTTGKMIGVEALIRWEHPTKGQISPAHFIPLAEETGLIIPIGEWVLRIACKQNKAWQDEGLPPMVVSVNLSVSQLYQPNIVETVRNILAETRLSAEYLELEITESMLMDTQQGHKVLNQLKNLGVKISLDDFGTGYSSLHYLKDSPIDRVKIDQSFVRNCAIDSTDATIVKTIIAMAHQLKLEVIAEGVERKEDLLFLQRNLCDEAQGYLFSKPLPPEEIASNYFEIEQVITEKGIPKEISYKNWEEEARKAARQELVDTVRQQQGMIFKFHKNNGKFIHTLFEGQLVYKFGLIPEQTIGRELIEIISFDEVEDKLKYYHKAWNGEEDVMYQGKYNGIFYLASLRPIKRGGKVVEVVGSCIDITERKQMEEALKLSELKYRLITENMSDLVGVWGLNGVIAYASPSHKAVLGFEPDIFVGNLGFEWVHREDVPQLQELFRDILLTKTPRKIEFRVKHASGNWIHTEASITPILRNNNVVEHFIVVGREHK